MSGAANAYAALGNIVHEAGGLGTALTIPYDTGLKPVAGTIGLKMRWDDIAGGSDAACGSGATSSTDPGVALFNLIDGTLRARITAPITQNGAGGLVSGIWHAVLLGWDASNIIARRDANETVTAHSATNYVTEASFWIGTTDNNADWNLAGAITKVVFYDELLDATNRANLIALLQAEPADTHHERVPFDGTEWYDIPHDALLDLPDGAWHIGGWIQLSDLTGSLFQYILSSGALGGANTLNFYISEASASPPNCFSCSINDGTTSTGVLIADTATPADETVWLWVLQSTGTHVELWLCEDGTSDVTRMINSEVDLDAVTPTINWNIGRRTDGDPNRYCANPMGGFFWGDGALSETQVEAIALAGSPESVTGSKLNEYFPLVNGMDEDAVGINDTIATYNVFIPSEGTLIPSEGTLIFRSDEDDYDVGDEAPSIYAKWGATIRLFNPFRQTIQLDPAGSGGKCYRILMPDGGSGTSCVSDIMGTWNDGNEVIDIAFECEIFLTSPSPLNKGADQKQPRIAGHIFSASPKRNVTPEDDCPSASFNVHFQRGLRDVAAVYAYYVNQPSSFGNMIDNRTVMPFGEWVHLRMECRAGSGVADGTLVADLNGKRYASLTGIKWHAVTGHGWRHIGMSFSRQEVDDGDYFLFVRNVKLLSLG